MILNLEGTEENKTCENISENSTKLHVIPM